MGDELGCQQAHAQGVLPVVRLLVQQQVFHQALGQGDRFGI